MTSTALLALNCAFSLSPDAVIEALEERLAERIGPGRTAATLVEEHRAGSQHGVRVELGDGGQPGGGLAGRGGQEVRRAGAHRGDELPLGHVPHPRGEDGQQLRDVGRQLPLGGVIAGAVGQAQDVHMTLDEAWDDRAPAKVDLLLSVAGVGLRADGHDAAIFDLDRADD
jgi:hypothetical protein